MMKNGNVVAEVFKPILFRKSVIAVFVLYGLVTAADYTWDVSVTAGTQPGSGTWGTDSYWSLDGTTLVAWPGSGNSATFGGADGTYTITVSGTQSVDSMAFVNSGYTLDGGSVYLGASSLWGECYQ